MSLKLKLILLMSLLAFAGSAQQAPKKGLVNRYLDYLFKDSNSVAEPKLLVYPTIGFAPETSWEIGFYSLYVYYANRDTTNRLSEISGFAFYTLENQYGFWSDHALYSDGDEWFVLGRGSLSKFSSALFWSGTQYSFQIPS